MNIFELIVKDAPISNRIEFGHNENVIISKIDIDERKYKGLPVSQNTFVTFSQLSPETKDVVAQSEVAFWNLKPNNEYTKQNFFDELTAMVAMVSAVGADSEKFQDQVTEKLDVTDEEFDAEIKNVKGIKRIQTVLSETFYSAMKNHIGEKCPLLKLKVKVDKKGYFEMGKEVTWILPMDSEEELAKITPREKRIYKESLKQTKSTKAEPDAVGESKVEKKVGKSQFDALT